MNSIIMFRSSILLSVICVFVDTSRTEKKIYYSVGSSECFRRLNATHQIGCSSDSGGNVGVLQYLENRDDYNWIMESGPNTPYVVLMGPEYFTKLDIKTIRDSGRVNGIMVLHVPENSTLTPIPPEGFSPDKNCPNEAHDMYSNNSDLNHCQKVKWNAIGSGMMFEDFGNFPIFAVTNATDIDFMINNCYRKFNKRVGGKSRDYPLCAVQIKSRMDAVKDAVTCMRRTNHQTNLNPDSFCQMLGDRNVFGTLKTVYSNETRQSNSVILVATRLDTFTLFDNISPSADNHVTGIVALLATAKALSTVKDKIQNTSDAKDIMFVFFQGEAFDYIGSSRMVYDMERNQFPYATLSSDTIGLHKIDLSHISSIVEISQVGYTDGGSHWIHTDPLSRSDTRVAKHIDVIVETLLNESRGFGESLKKTDNKTPLPPASTHRFLMRRNIPAVVLTDHDKQFTNKFYNSRFDLPENINVKYPENLNSTEKYNYITEQAKMLSNFSTVVARALYKMSTGLDSAEIEVSSLDVTNLLYCYLVLPNCDLFHTVVKDEDLSKNLNKMKRPYDYYVTVYGSKSKYINSVTVLTRRVLSYFIGDKETGMVSTNCSTPNSSDKMFEYFWMQGKLNQQGTRDGFCIKASVDFSDSYSPAFLDQDNIDWSGTYSTWTESVWQPDAIDLRLFLVPDKQFETVVLSVGVILLLVSLVIVWFINLNADIIFCETGTPEFL